MVVAAVCDNDRRRAVASELKFTGQVGRAIKFFGVEMNTAETAQLLRIVLPMAFNRARLVHGARIKANDKRNILAVARETRDSLLRSLPDFFTPREWADLEQLRLGILRTTTGVLQLDAAVAARTGGY